jgi:hypothetical protein
MRRHRHRDRCRHRVAPNQENRPWSDRGAPRRRYPRLARGSAGAMVDVPSFARWATWFRAPWSATGEGQHPPHGLSRRIGSSSTSMRPLASRGGPGSRPSTALRGVACGSPHHRRWISGCVTFRSQATDGRGEESQRTRFRGHPRFGEPSRACSHRGYNRSVRIDRGPQRMCPKRMSAERGPSSLL